MPEEVVVAEAEFTLDSLRQVALNEAAWNYLRRSGVSALSSDLEGWVGGVPLILLC